MSENGEQDRRDAVIVPLSADAPLDNPWQTVASGQGILVSFDEAPHDWEKHVGVSLTATSALGRSLQQIVADAARSSSSVTGLAKNAALFTIELPGSSVLSDLIPAAGGGFRGMTRAADGAKIAGHVRLIPAGGGEAAAVVGGLALGPAIALMAVAVASEAIARHQLEKKLNAIHDALKDLQANVRAGQSAKLESAEQALRQGAAAVLDRVRIPDSVGLGPAVNGVRELVAEGKGWLEGWERGAKQLVESRGSTGVDFADMCRALNVPQDNVFEFARRVEIFYRALVLDARAKVLAEAEAATAHPESPLSHLRQGLSADLQANAQLQQRLREVLWELASEPLSFSLPAMPSTGKKVAACDRMVRGLASSLARMPDAPPILLSNNHQVLEVVRKKDGSVHVLNPAANARQAS